MRITGGELRGRKLRAPRTGVRPTQERVREALFSSLATRVPGARVLDLYAGSGALGLEAWSRGAAEVHWVENDKRTFRQLQENVRTLCGEEEARLNCHCADSLAFLQRAGRRPGRRYDLVLADPPYDPGGEGETLEKTLQQLTQEPILLGSGLLIYEQSKKQPVAQATGWMVWKEKVYGSTRLVMYRPSIETRPEEAT